MKDGVKTLAIVPFDNVLEFIGPVRPPDNSQDLPDSLTIKGEARFTLARPVKIRGMSIKFKGFSRIVQNHHEAITPLLPKLKRPLFGRTSLPAGEHIIPWDIEVPNIYPRSFNIKHASIFYKIEVSIAIGLQKKTMTAEHPIEIRRHLLHCKEMLPLVETQLIDKTIPAKFHYEIHAPQIVCVEQGSIPIAVRFLCFANQKPVRRIRTQLTQIEIYSFPSISKSSTDVLPVTTNEGYKKLAFNFAGSFMASRQQRKFVKRVVPALKHIISSNQQTSTWQQRLILRHQLIPIICPALDSPLITIYHQLEVVFQFEHQFENIKAKIPIVITTVPADNGQSSHFASMAFKKFASQLQDISRPESMITIPGQEVTHVEETDPMEDGDSVLPGVHYRVLGDPISRRGGLPVTASSINLLMANKNPGRLSPDELGRGIRKCASVSDLDSKSKEEGEAGNGLVDDEDDDEEAANQARVQAVMATDPTIPIQQRRRGGGRPALAPIDVDLANGLLKRPVVRPTAHQDRAGTLAPVDMNLMRSKARLQQVQEQSRRNMPQASQPKPPSKPDSNRSFDYPNSSNLAISQMKPNQDTASEMNPPPQPPPPRAALLDSNHSGNYSENGFHGELRTRPPSPEFCPAPGLPSSVALVPKEALTMSLPEESFLIDQDSTKSPALATIASSTLLSPRTSYMLRRSGVAQTSLNNHGRPLGRESSTLDPDGEILRRIWCIQDRQQDTKPPPLPPLPALPMQEKPATVNLPNEDQVPVYQTKLPPLPPLPPSTQLPDPPPVIPRVRKTPQDPQTHTRRMTKLYVEDSDDEVLDPLPPIPDNTLQERIDPAENTDQTEQPEQPEQNDQNEQTEHTKDTQKDAVPQLPRLSLGTAFSASLNMGYT